jgi:hypothetical protein
MDWLKNIVKAVAPIIRPIVNVVNAVIQAVAPKSDIARAAQAVTNTVNAWTAPASTSSGQSGSQTTSSPASTAVPDASLSTSGLSSQWDTAPVSGQPSREDELNQIASESADNWWNDPFANKPVPTTTGKPPIYGPMLPDDFIETQPSTQQNMATLVSVLGLDTLDDTVQSHIQAFENTLEVAGGNYQKQQQDIATIKAGLGVVENLITQVTQISVPPGTVQYLQDSRLVYFTPSTDVPYFVGLELRSYLVDQADVLGIDLGDVTNLSTQELIAQFYHESEKVAWQKQGGASMFRSDLQGLYASFSVELPPDMTPEEIMEWLGGDGSLPMPGMPWITDPYQDQVLAQNPNLTEEEISQETAKLVLLERLQGMDESYSEYEPAVLYNPDWENLSAAELAEVYTQQLRLLDRYVDLEQFRGNQDYFGTWEENDYSNQLYTDFMETYNHDLQTIERRLPPPPDYSLLVLVGSILLEPIDWLVTGVEVVQDIQKSDFGSALFNAGLAIAPFASGWMDNALRQGDEVVEVGENLIQGAASANVIPTGNAHLDAPFSQIQNTDVYKEWEQFLTANNEARVNSQPGRLDKQRAVANSPDAQAMALPPATWNTSNWFSGNVIPVKIEVIIDDATSYLAMLHEKIHVLQYEIWRQTTINVNTFTKDQQNLIRAVLERQAYQFEVDLGLALNLDQAFIQDAQNWITHWDGVILGRNFQSELQKGGDFSTVVNAILNGGP